MKTPLIISIKSTKLSAKETYNISKHKPFGVILFARNIKTINQVVSLNKSIKKISKHTLIFVDQEGGIVNRFKNFKDLKFKDNYEYYKIYLKHPSLAQQLVYLKNFITSYYLVKMGFDSNTVPVLDLPLKNTAEFIKKRTFGPDFEIAFTLNKIIIDVNHHFGLFPVIKHIPGHGVTSKDSHLSLPISKLSSKQLEQHLVLFNKFKNINLAMTAHIQYNSWDSSNIATFSSNVIKNIIRKKIGFKGLLMSDDLTMKANTYDIENTIKLANKVGLDILLDCGSDWDRYLEIIKNFKNSKNYSNLITKKTFHPKRSLKLLESININHYVQLYNELLKIYGI